MAIYTDSKVTVDSLKNDKMHGVLIEEIRNMVRNLTQQNWTTYFGWVKTHAGIEGNKIAERLAKEAAQDKKGGTYVNDRISISTVASRVKEEGLKNGRRNGKMQ